MTTTYQKNKRGRPRTAAYSIARPEYRSEQSLIAYADQQAAAFEQLSAAQRAETIARVRRILAAEQRQRRRSPSPLAQIATRVYGIPVDWLPLSQQLSPSDPEHDARPVARSRDTFDRLLEQVLADMEARRV